LTLFPLAKIQRTDECLVYHDESKRVLDDRVWAHGLLFVPESARVELLKRLYESINKHNCENNSLHFAEISGKKICAQDGSIVIRDWVNYGVEALRRKGSTIFRPALNCKLGIIIFNTAVPLDPYGGNTEGERKLRYFETVLRMLLKGCAHYLYDENNRLRIKGIITDGNSWHRKMNAVRILRPLLTETRNFVEIDRQAYIEAVPKDHCAPDCVDRDSAHLLKLIDQLIGCVVQSCFRQLSFGQKKEIIARPVREMLDKRNRGRNFRASGHYKQFTISYAQLINKQWRFKQIDARAVSHEGNQLILPEFDS